MLRGTAREDCDTKDFLSQSKKVLVTLIRFICSFFSAARRTNQEAPPRLSGFWVCRRSRRRGLRNSLRSDSPRPFSSVFLATSPPDKGGDFAHAFAGLFNPSVLAGTPPIAHSCAEEEYNTFLSFYSFLRNKTKHSNLLPCRVPQHCGVFLHRKI